MRSYLRTLRPSIALAAAALGGCVIAHTATEGNNMSIKKPYYSAHVVASGTPFDVRVNDCPILSGQSGMQNDTDVPINQWVHNGENRLRITLTKCEGKQGECDVIIQYIDYDNPDEPAIEVAKFVARALPLAADSAKESESGTTKTQEPTDTTVEDSFSATTPFSDWAWLSVPVVDLSDQDRSTILAKAKEIWQSLKSKNMSQVKQILALKLKEYGEAYYNGAEQQAEDLEKSYLGYLNDPDWQVDEFKDGNLRLERYGNGRIFLLQNAKTRKSPMLFANKDRTLGHYIPLYFFKDSSGNWQIIR
jgi:hypothetical protein